MIAMNMATTKTTLTASLGLIRRAGIMAHVLLPWAATATGCYSRQVASLAS